jgi:hypothetical protein
MVGFRAPAEGRARPQGARAGYGALRGREDGGRLSHPGVGETNGTGEMNWALGKRINDLTGKHRAGIEQQLNVSSRRSRRA